MLKQIFKFFTMIKINKFISFSKIKGFLFSGVIMVSQYKDLIREQDIQIQRLKHTNEFLTKEKQELEVASKFFFF